MTDRSKMTNDQKFLHDAQLELGVTPAEMAALLYTSIHTYRAWLYGKRRLPGVAWKAIELLLEIDANDDIRECLRRHLTRQKC